MDLGDLHNSIIDLLEDFEKHYPEDYKGDAEYTRFIASANYFLNWGHWEDKDE